MSYVIGAIAAIFAVLSAAVYALFSKNKSLRQLLASQAIRAELKEWGDKIAASELKVEESERDYADAKKKFNNPDSDDK